MGMEVVSDVAQVAVEAAIDGDNSLMHEKENGKLSQGQSVSEPIKFGLHGTVDPIEGPRNDAAQANFPKDAVDEWPEPKQIHTFFFVRYRSYEDPNLKTKLDFADKEIQKKNKARSQVTEALKARRSDRAQVISQLKFLTAEDKQLRSIVDGKRKEMEPLQEALGKLRGSNNAGQEKGFGLCSSEEELDELIQHLNNRIQHESISLNEEKQIIREISQLQRTREKVIANAAMRAKIQESLGQKEEIQDQVKLMGVDLGGVKKEKQAIKAKIKSLEEELKAIDDDIKSLQAELELATQKRDNAYEGLQQLRKQREGGNALFYQNRSLLNKAKELAAKRDLTSLEELSHTEMEAFMSLWSSNKVIRDDYEKRVLRSLDSRELSRDGRIRNWNEKPLLAVESQTPVGTETAPKVLARQQKEDSKSLTKQGTSILKGQKEAGNDKVTDSTSLDPADKEIKEKNSGLELEKPQKDSSENEIDPAKLKEMKREEEIAKAKLAFDRKKKLAEKAAAKAAVRAQKEAQKKLKEREKKAKKKAAASATENGVDEPTEVPVEVVDRGNTGKDTETPVPPKNKDRKENIIKERHRGKRLDSRPKPIFKRKKSTNYWIWAASVSVLLVLFLALGYYYVL